MKGWKSATNDTNFTKKGKKFVRLAFGQFVAKIFELRKSQKYLGSAVFAGNNTFTGKLLLAATIGACVTFEL
jgi:hypothetical protein